MDNFDVPMAPLAEPYEVRRFDYNPFLYNQYNWKGFDNGFGVIKLSPRKDTGDVYFMFVDKSKLKKLSKLDWYANIHRDRDTGEIKKIYAIHSLRMDELLDAQGRLVKKKSKKYKANRVLAAHRHVRSDVGKAHKVDHRNNCGLDNRTINLRPLNHSGNIANSWAGPPKTKNGNLPRGVHPVHLKGGTKYRARICHNEEEYSATFDTVEKAKVWYDKKHKEFFRFPSIASHKNGAPSLPVFPPRLGVDDDIPF